MSMKTRLGYYTGLSFNGRLVGTDTQLANTAIVGAGAPAAGSSNFITDICICAGATGRTYKLLDGSGGTVLWQVGLAASTSSVMHLSTPIRQAAATALVATADGASTGQAIFVNGFVDRTNY